MAYKLADEYVTQDASRFNELRNLPSCAEPLSGCDAPDDLAVVFHMGESVRADHLSLNGYHQNTMPLLSREPNVVSFPHATSFGIVTQDFRHRHVYGCGTVPPPPRPFLLH